MSGSGSVGPWSRLGENPLARVVAYYVLLFGATALLVELVPGAAALVNGGVAPSEATDAGVRDVLSGGGGTPLFSAPVGLPISEVFAMASAFLLMLPVAWIYILTRQRKGFRQSVVQRSSSCRSWLRAWSSWSRTAWRWHSASAASWPP